MEASLLYHSCVCMYRRIPKHFLIEYIRNLKTYLEKLCDRPGSFALSMGCSCSGTGIANKKRTKTRTTEDNNNNDTKH